MKVVDSIPVTFDRLNNYTGSCEMAPVVGKRPRRFRTVSESAVVRQQMLDDIKSDGVTSSLKNIAEKELTESSIEIEDTTIAGDSSSSSSRQSTVAASDEETAPLTSNLELNVQNSDKFRKK